MVMAFVDSSSLQADSQPKSVGFISGSAACIDQINHVNFHNGYGRSGLHYQKH